MHRPVTVSDEELVALTIERDAHAFEALFERYADALHRHAAHIVRDDAAAHDVVQEAFLRVWTRGAQWRGTGSFRAWFYRTVTNLALNHLRTVRRRREIPLEIPADPEDEEDTISHIPAWMVEASSLGPEAVVEESEARELARARYRTLVGQLPEDKREVFRMVNEMEMSVRDTADTLDIPEGTVKSRLHYARRKLARAWREMEDE